MVNPSKRELSMYELRFRVLTALRELTNEQGKRDGYFKPPSGLKAFAIKVLQDTNLSGRRVKYEIINCIVEDGWIERNSHNGHFWRICPKAPQSLHHDISQEEEESATIPNNTAQTTAQLVEALESALLLAAQQAVALADLKGLLELLSNLQHLDPHIMNPIQLKVIKEIQTITEPLRT